MNKPINSGDPIHSVREPSHELPKEKKSKHSLDNRIARVAKLLHSQTRDEVKMGTRKVEISNEDPLNLLKND